MADIGTAEARIPGSMSQQQEIAKVVHGSSRLVFLGPFKESDGEFVVTSHCQGNPEHITMTGVVCHFNELQKVPGITKAERCPNCPLA